MTLNGENSEMEVIIEIKIKFTPSLQMLGVINRMLPDDQKIKQPIRDEVKPDTPPAAESQSVENSKLKPTESINVAATLHFEEPDKGSVTTTAAPASPITGIPWPATPPAAGSQSVENSELKPTESINVAATPHFEEPDKESVKPVIDLATDPQPLREIEKIDTGDYLHDPVAVSGFKNLSYAETKDKRLKIMYGSSRVNTTWADIHTICECKFKQQKKDAIERLVGPGSAKNKYTAVSRFVKAVSIGAVSPYKPKIPTDDDPDAVFEPVLSGVIDTHVDEGGGKAESHISEGY